MNGLLEILPALLGGAGTLVSVAGALGVWASRKMTKTVTLSDSDGYRVYISSRHGDGRDLERQILIALAADKDMSASESGLDLKHF